MQLILFDIDGTLIDSGEAGTRSLNLAFKDLFSIEDAFRGISMAGRTDVQIMREGLERHNIMDNGNLEALISAYLKNLQREINNDRKHTKPGIYEILDALSSYPSVKLGLLTGNLESGARIKLEPFGLNKYFPAGAFGSDDEHRDKLLPIAISRFEKLLNTKISGKDCIVIGDTPLDIYCAKPYGAMSVGVATGPFTVDALIQAGADHVFENFSEYSGLLQIFG